MVAFALNADIAKPDEAYPWLLQNIIPVGIKGVIFAALIAAIVSSFSAIINSTSTIFTMDIYKVHFNPEASENKLVAIGRVSSVVAMTIAVFVAASLGNLEQAFQFIQEYTGMVSPGITAIFIFGMYWKKTTSNAAFWGTLLSIPISAAVKYLFVDMPFLDQMLVSFFIISLVIVIISILDKSETENRAVHLERSMFKTGRLFNALSIIVFLILMLIYMGFL